MPTVGMRCDALDDELNQLQTELLQLKGRIDLLSEKTKAYGGFTSGPGNEFDAGSFCGVTDRADEDGDEDDDLASLTVVDSASRAFHRLNGTGSPTEALTRALKYVFEGISNSSSSDSEPDDVDQPYFDMTTHREYMRRLGAVTHDYQPTILLSVDHDEKTKWGVTIPQLYCAIQMILPLANIIPVYHGSRYSELCGDTDKIATAKHLIDGYKPNLVVIPGNNFHIHPMEYGDEIDDKVTNCIASSQDRYAFEQALFMVARSRGIPMLGVCGGMQVMAVSLDCKLNQCIDHVPAMAQFCWPRYPQVESVLHVPLLGSSTSFMVDTVLQACQLIVRSDTRQEQKNIYLQKLRDIRTWLTSIHAHNESIRGESIAKQGLSKEMCDDLKLLFAHVRTLNPWSGFAYDQKDDSLHAKVFCHHTQSVNKDSVPLSSLAVTAFGVAGHCKDVCIEAITSDNADGIQFHPEMMLREDIIENEHCDDGEAISKYGFFAVSLLDLVAKKSNAHRCKADMNDEFKGHVDSKTGVKSITCFIESKAM